MAIKTAKLNYRPRAGGLPRSRAEPDAAHSGSRGLVFGKEGGGLHPASLGGFGSCRGLSGLKGSAVMGAKRPHTPIF